MIAARAVKPHPAADRRNHEKLNVCWFKSLSLWQFVLQYGKLIHTQKEPLGCSGTCIPHSRERQRERARTREQGEGQRSPRRDLIPGPEPKTDTSWTEPPRRPYTTFSCMSIYRSRICRAERELAKVTQLGRAAKTGE